MTSQRHILIIEDGDEYLRFFSRHLNQYHYFQARCLDDCVSLLSQERCNPQAFILDIRFDRVDPDQLIGDVEDLAVRMFGGIEEVEAARRYVVDNQGYLILRALRDQGYMQPAVMIADLPERQQKNLNRLYGPIAVVESFDRSAIDRALRSVM